VTLCRLAASAGLVLTTSSLAAGCRDEPAPPAPARELTTRGEEAAPVDHTLPGELAEGNETAFGLRLPRGMAINAAFATAIFAKGNVAPEHVANYVRQRVVSERVETGPSKTLFLRAKVGRTDLATADLGRVLRIDVISQGGVTELVVRDETPAPMPQGKSQNDILREYGLGPDGKLLDATTLE
jgi:hypothetical protein